MQLISHCLTPGYCSSAFGVCMGLVIGAFGPPRGVTRLFNLLKDRSLRFRVYPVRLIALLGLAFATAPPIGLTLPHRVPARLCTVFNYRAVTVSGRPFHAVRLTVLGHVAGFTTPNDLHHSVWALPRSLAATEGIEISFCSSGHAPSFSAGFEVRFPRKALAFALLQGLHVSARLRRNRKLIPRAVLTRVSAVQGSRKRLSPLRNLVRRRSEEPQHRLCGANRDRTDDLRLAKPALSQLSYNPERGDPAAGSPTATLLRLHPSYHSLLGTLPLAVGLGASGANDSHGVTGGVYKARERIHRCLLISDY
ncbi:hypothetical protein OUZ56_033175 [Daphnia magna]|uniref:Uncharacterized protein n=1 Tax=Daphnia magna TaxID=35525 RepID=A0ABR0BAE0_9CRUS|nr:hypothetical protein OUZ56_033175 [Daphnia magna]